MSKPKVVVLCGGKSTEYEVSLWSALNWLRMIDRSRYEPGLIRISRSGAWGVFRSSLEPSSAPPELDSADSYDDVILEMTEPCRVVNARTKERIRIDLAVPCIHGQFGEDGTIQGLLNALGIPFVGCGLTASAVGFDKVLTKQLFERQKIPVVPYLVARRGHAPGYEQVKQQLGMPVVVKPARSGSSVGVSLVKSQEELTIALDELCSQADVVIERYEKGREVECAVLDTGIARASLVGEIQLLNDRPLYDYEAKYQDQSAVNLVIPAELPAHVTERVQKLAVAAHQVLGCWGLSRVDFFIVNGDIFVNEINTMPGFTNQSMYPMMWEKLGLENTELGTELIEAGFARGSPAG